MRIRCSFCGEKISQSDFERGLVADYPVFKYGELSSIELFHEVCALEAREDYPGIRFRSGVLDKETTEVS
jgi:hypothetical protein